MMPEQQCLNFEQFYHLLCSRQGSNNDIVSLEQHIECCTKCADDLSFIETLYKSMLEEKRDEENIGLEELRQTQALLELLSLSEDRKVILDEIAATEVADRLAPYKRQFIIGEPSSVSLVSRIANLFKNKAGTYSWSRLAAGFLVVLFVSFISYRQISFLRIYREANEAYAKVLDKFKISPDDIRPSDSLPKIITSPRMDKAIPPQIHAAEVVITHALARKPDDAKLNHQLGTVYFFSRNMAKAEQFYLKALALDKTNAKIYNDLALIDINRKNLNKALVRLTRALHLAPTLLEAQYNLAIVFELQDDTAKAIQAWEKYLKMDPDRNSDWNRLARRRLGELRE